MTVTISIDDNYLAARLDGEAKRQGIEPAELAIRILDKSLRSSNGSGAGGAEADAATLALLRQWDREDETDYPAEIARQEQELQVFMEGMNRNRLASEGPAARKIYP